MIDGNDGWFSYFCPQCGGIAGFDEDGRAVVTGVQLERVRIVHAVIRWCPCGHNDAGYFAGEAPTSDGYVREWFLTPLIDPVWRSIALEGDEQHPQRNRYEPGE